MIQWGFMPTRLQWAASCFREDPVFAAQAYRMTQACPGDPQTALLCLELATMWANDNPEARAAVPGMPPLPIREPVVPFDVLEHWLDWQRHLGRMAGTLMERDGYVILGYPLPTPVVFVGNDAFPSPVMQVANGGLIQVQASSPLALGLPKYGFEEVVRQTVAVMPTMAVARLPRELPEGFYLQRVETPEHVADYQKVTHEAYTASYGATGSHLLFRAQTFLGHDNVQAWIVYQGTEPVRVISGFVAHGIVGAHAGAAVPSVRGRHFSEPLLAHVAAWGHALGANLVAGIAMPQAVPILTRIGADLVDEYVTYRRAA